jgi:hypothetical protein
MRYLKTYKIFESSEEDIMSFLKDIFLDLEDMDFNVSIEKSTLWKANPLLQTDFNVFSVLIYKSDTPVYYSPNKSDRFKLKDVLETILDAERYMKSEGYKIDSIESKEIKDDFGNSFGKLTTYRSNILNISNDEFITKETYGMEIKFTKE